MATLYGVLLSIGILITQHYLSCRNNPFWGGILPVAYIGLMVWFLYVENVEFQSIFVIVFLFLLSIWADGRIRVKHKRKKELEKITLKDL